MSNKANLILVLLSLFVFDCFSQNYHIKRGNKLHEKEEFIRAIKQYSKALLTEDDNKVVLFNRARCYRKIGDYQKALLDINNCLTLDSNYKNGLKEKGAIIAILGNYSESIIYFTKAIEIDSFYASAYNGRGAAYYLLGKYENAIKDNLQAIELDSKFDDSYYNVGLSYCQLNLYEEAISYFNKSIELDFDDHQSFFERGRSLYEIGEYRLAEKDYGQAVVYNKKLDPWEKIDNGWAYYYKGLSNIKIDSIENACVDFKQAVFFGNYLAEEEYNNLNCTNNKNAKKITPKTKNDIKSNDTVNVNIFPNPVESFSKISIESDKEGSYDLEIYNVSGEVITVIKKIGKSFIFNRKNLQSGMYIFIIKNNDQIISTNKIILK